MDTLAVDADDLIAQRTEEGWNGWPADGKSGHLHLKTHDIGQARDFYVEQIGLEHISNFPQALFMSTQNIIIISLLMYGNPTKLEQITRLLMA